MSDITKHLTSKDVECVGSLLVPQQDLKELSEVTGNQESDESEGSQSNLQGPSSNPNEGLNSSTLMRRITEEMRKPVSKESEDEIEELWMTWSS